MANVFKMFKPYQNKGAASQWEIAVKIDDKTNTEKVMVFLKMAKEIPSTGDNSAFAWQDESQSVQMKLGDADIAELLAVIRGPKNQAGPDNGKGLFHQNKLGNSALKFSYNDDKKNFALEVSSKRGNDLVKVYHTVTMGEALMLGVLLEEYTRRKFDWINAVAFEKS